MYRGQEPVYLEIGVINLLVFPLVLEDVVPPIRELNWSDSYVVGYQSAFRVTDQLTDALGGDAREGDATRRNERGLDTVRCG